MPPINCFFALFVLLHFCITSFGQTLEEINQKISKLEEEGDFQNVQILYKQAQVHYKNNKDWEPYVIRYCELGYANWVIGQTNKMEVYLDSALLAAKQVELDTFSDAYSYIWNYYGYYYHQIGYTEKAIHAYRKSLAIDLYNQVDSTDIGRAYNNIGTQYNAQGNYPEAISFFNRALNFLPTPSTIRANLQNNFAFSYQKMGQIEKSIAYNKLAINTLSVLKDNNRKRNRQKVCYQNISSSYNQLGKIDSCNIYLEVFKNLINSTDSIRLSNYYGIKGGNYFIQKNYTDALTNYHKALLIRKRKLPKKHTYKAVSLREIGQVHFEKAEYPKALKFFQSAISALVWGFDEISPPNVQPSLAAQIVDKVELLRVLEEKGKTLTALKQSENALTTYLYALDLAKSLRIEYLAKDAKLNLLKRIWNLYENAIKIAFELDNKALVFELIEKSKGTLILENHQNELAKLAVNIPDSILNKEADLTAQIAYCERQILRALENEDKEKINFYEKDLFDLQQAHQILVKRLESSFPTYFQLKYNTAVLSIEQVKNQLINSNQGIIEYFMGDSTTYIIGISKKSVATHQIPTKIIRSKINNLIPSLSQYFSRNQLDTSYLSLAFDFYQTVLANPVNSLPSKVNELIIIPDNKLALIPFDLLLNNHPKLEKKLPFLLNRYAITYANSCTLLDLSLNEKKTQNNSFVGFAPSFSKGKTIVQNSPCHSALLSPISHNQTEVNSISSLLSGNAYLDTFATKINFQQSLKNYGLLHLATHACVDENNPTQSRIFFTKDFLYIHELFNLDLTTQMVVLSACETGLGKYQKGEGVLSLAHAFAYAGVPSITMSLWSVNDQSTAELMQYFYQHLKAGKAKHQALRQAKLDYLANQESVEKLHPYYWAGFVHVGNFEPIQFSRQPRLLHYGLIGGLALIGIGFWFSRKNPQNLKPTTNN